MEYLTTQNSYRSPYRKVPFFTRKFPSLVYYLKMLRLVFWGSRKAKSGEFTIEKRVEGTLKIMKALESVGVQFEVENLASFRELESPCVFVSNHMSTLETFILPGVIEPDRANTFVIKESLIKYPVFKHIMLSLDPVVVSRENPREDFEKVMNDGQERLNRGISIVVFPQTTRSTRFDPTQFNTIGIKLARRAGVPVIPVALKTDAWGNNDRFVKEFGRIDPSKSVHLSFGDPIYVHGNGKNEHEFIVQFISDKLNSWI